LKVYQQNQKRTYTEPIHTNSIEKIALVTGLIGLSVWLIPFILLFTAHVGELLNQYSDPDPLAPIYSVLNPWRDYLTTWPRLPLIVFLAVLLGLNGKYLSTYLTTRLKINKYCLYLALDDYLAAIISLAIPIGISLTPNDTLLNLLSVRLAFIFPIIAVLINTFMTQLTNFFLAKWWPKPVLVNKM
jgi:hypothetical protein